MQTETLIEKINSLPLQRQAEVEDFVDFLAQREDERLIASATKASEPAFARVWENDEDSVYDKL